MAALTGNQIKTSYNGLLKTVDNTAIDGTLKQLTDGDGNALPMEVSTSGVNFTGTVTGIPLTVGGFTGVTQIDAGTNLTATEIAPGIVQLDAAGGGGGFVGVSDLTKVTETTTGTDLVYKSLLIPANTFVAGDIIKLEALLNMDMSNGGFIYWSAWISASTTPLSGFPIGGGQRSVGTPAMAVVSKHLYIYTADGTGDATSFLSDLTAVEQSEGDGYVQYNDSNVRAINWTSDVYINFLVYIDNPGNFITFNGGYIKKMN